MNVSVNKAKTLKPRPEDDNLPFGTIFTDHMFNMDYEPEKGWHNARIEPYAPIQMEPSALVLHYGQSVFEGLKAYRTEWGDIHLYRPLENFKRLKRSCRAVCIPEIDENLALDMLKQLLEVDKDWIPSAPETSLYIRPTIVAMDPFVGVRASHTYRFFIILSPVGAYYPEGFNPVKIWVTKDHVRAVPGGVGDVKTAANYAASLYAGEDAHKHGYTQVLWLDGIEHKYVEEVGAMNIFFVIDDEVITPMLTGSILPGITRDSVIQLSKKWGKKVTERKISIDEIIEANTAGKLQEMFGSGTAAVISPVGEIKYGDKNITVGDGKVGPVSQQLYSSMTDMQYGRAEDIMGWIEVL
jgi:branched-chain amino acid aminotransferase